mmetsp:Transcript_27968/g.75535  ORF Transcript_27968/g.75535 Transcript_27968/m.75535 type:complete len:123 (+) Transcript_27968:337-705(+)
MVVPRRADFDFRATSASRVALDSIEQPTDADTADLPALPEEVWTYIFEIRAATTIQAKVRGFKTRHGPIRYLLIYVKKGWLPPARAVFWATELQRRGAPHHYVLLDTPGGTGASMSRVECVD